MLWKSSPSFPDYAISETGDVVRQTPARGARVGKLLKPYTREDGYSMYILRRDLESYHVKAHQLVAEAFIGPKPFPAAEVCHKDGSRTNDHYKNLRWDTRKANHADKLIHGTDFRGERHPGSKLTTADVIEMRRIYREDANSTCLAIGKLFGISQIAALRVITGKRWGHIPGAVPSKSKGRKGGHSDLSDEQVVAMRQLFAAGHDFKELQKQFGGSGRRVWCAVRGKTFSHLPGAIAGRRYG